jgi:hypothetical protein
VSEANRPAQSKDLLFASATTDQQGVRTLLPLAAVESRPYFSPSLKNKYLPRNSSFRASGVALKCITGHPSAGE